MYLNSGNKSNPYVHLGLPNLEKDSFALLITYPPCDMLRSMESRKSKQDLEFFEEKVALSC